MNDDRTKILNSQDLRGVLFETMVGVLEGRVNVSQANAVVGLSSEAHKSIRQQWDMDVYAEENLSLSAGKISRLALDMQEDDDDDA